MEKLERIVETFKVMAVLGLLIYGACIMFNAVDDYLNCQMNLWSNHQGN